MRRIIIVLATIGIAYWYWTGPYQHSTKTASVDDPKKNAQIMAECIARENFAQQDSHRDAGENPEDECADENGLYKIYGEWHRR